MRNRATVVDAIEEQLTHQPTVATRRRKLLRANPLADWEPRVGQYRVFYVVDQEAMRIDVLAIGLKVRNVLLIGGKEYQL